MAPARLTSSLLARKGEAQPSGSPASTIGLVQPLPSAAAAAGPAMLRRPQAKILVPAWGATATVAGGGRPGEPARVNVSARIDRALHTRLRVLAARQQRTQQDVLRAALDAYLELLGAGCPCLAEAKRKDLAEAKPEG